MVEKEPKTKEFAEQDTEDEINVLEFLKEKRPPKEIKETSPEQVGLIESLRKKVDDYKIKLEESGARGDAVQRLATEYAVELRRAQQDPRPYIDLGNRTFATGRLNEEITEAIPLERDPTIEDLDRVWRLDHDLDEFKTINDYYGHRAGDEILHAYSEILNGGETVSWLKNSGVLDERGPDQPQSFEASVEGGEEFGAMIVFKEKFSPIKLEDGRELSSKEEILKEFISRIQTETNNKFKEVLTQKDDEGKKVFPIIAKPPEGVEFPEDFVMETGSSFGFASAREAAENIVISESDDFETVLQKIRNNMFEISDGRAIDNKLERKIAREKSDDVNTRLTAEISPRGRAEALERQNRELAGQANQALERADSAENTIAKLEGQIAGLRSAFESIKEAQGYEMVRETLLKQIQEMESIVETFRQKAA